MADEKLSPERAIRLLRAKGAELEHRVLIEQQTLDEPMTTLGTNMLVTYLAADIALIAQLLADHIERFEALHDDSGLPHPHRLPRSDAQ